MRYKQAAPVEGWRGSYTHTIYWGGQSGYDQLNADISMLPRTGRDNQLDYWPCRWRVIQLYARKWLVNPNDKTARAVILHHRGDNASSLGLDWNSLYLASQEYLETNTQCKIVGNDYFLMGESAEGNVAKSVVNFDSLYLKQLHHAEQALFEKDGLTPSPAIFVRPTVETKPSLTTFGQPAPSSSSVQAVNATWLDTDQIVSSSRVAVVASGPAA